jgi:hypothetical protein
LAQVGFINTVHLGELDALFLEGSGCFLVVRSKRLAVPAPSAKDDTSVLSQGETKQRGKRAYHGAKNSTRMTLSGSTTDLKLAGVKSMTSEAASATARVARVRETAEARSDGMRILGQDSGQWDKKRGFGAKPNRAY